MKVAIIGAGGFARELYLQILSNDRNTEVDIFADDEYTYDDVLPISMFNPEHYITYIGVADPNLREYFVQKLPPETVYGTFIHNSVQCHEKHRIGHGTMIMAGSILTTNIKLGEHCLINLQTSIGHDATLGNFVTTSPKVSISGSCKISDKVYLGTACAIKEKISITSGVSVGMGAMVVKDITEQQTTWVGIPAKKLK